MKTSAELIMKANQLMEQAKEARKTEMASIIDDIKKTIAENGITAEDLGYLPMRKKREPKVAAEVSAVSTESTGGDQSVTSDAKDGSTEE